jgi:signal transduction histidine kinase
MSSIGNSLHLQAMLKEFCRTVIKRTSGIAAKCVKKNTHEEIVTINHKKFNLDINYNDLEENILMHNCDSYLVLILNNTICFFQYSSLCDIDLIWLHSVLKSFKKKLNNSIEACLAYEEKEQEVKLEVEKNKQKDLLLQQQSRLAQMGEMISMIAHQWRQPLASISSIAVAIKIKLSFEQYNFSTLQGQNEFIDNLELQVDDIENLVETLTSTIDDFRDFYKPNKQLNSTNITIPIEKSLNIIKNQIQNQNIKIKQNYNTFDEASIYDNELMQVILNIFKNSMDNFKYKNKENPIITILTKKENEKIIISICDNGGGIKPSIINKIFDPYFSTKDDKNGTGLGLYMSKIIIEQHHKGKFYAKNIDNGVCFFIEI